MNNQNQANDAPRVAVIICAYNMEKYLPESLDSALALRYPNLEIIVVDDGSTDGTRDLIQQNYKEKVTYVYQDNRGLFSARRTGIAHAGKAQYYSIIDADDIVHPLKVWDEVAFLERNPDVAICFSNLFLFNKDNEGIGDYWDGKNLIDAGQVYGEIANPIEKIAKFKAFTSVSTIRASSYQHVGGYDGSLKCSGDMDLAIRLTRVGGVGYINKLRYLYRHDDHGMTLYMRNRIKVYMKIFDKIQKSADDFTDEELSYLCLMEKNFLMQALWGTYLGSTDKSMRKEIKLRLQEKHRAQLDSKYYILQCFGMLGLANIISKLRNSQVTGQGQPEKKHCNKEILGDMSPCFDNV